MGKGSPWQLKEPWDLKKVQIMTDLARSMQQEEDAIADYRERLKVAEDAGDSDTAARYKHVIPEEEEHLKEFTKRLHEMEGV